VPQIVGLVVIQVDRRPELVGRQPVPVGQQIPGEIDSLFLEVVAEGKVAQHLEKGMVPGRVAHIFQVVVFAAGPHALL
jgi:hypothetical protein